MKKVIAAGHICLDITPAIPMQGSERIGDILSPGKLLSVGGADIHTGGSVANTGLAMKILGADVSLAGKIGDDFFGEMVETIISGYGAGDGLIKKQGESTSYSVVLAIPGFDRIFLHNPGANDTFCSEDLSKKLIEEAALFHFGYPPLMKRIYENDGEELVRIMQMAHDAGAATSLDLASVDPSTEAGKADWETILSKVLPLTDIFVPSVEELCFMLDRKMYERISKEAGNRDFTEVLELERDIVPLAEKCMAYGAKILLIKCGAPGMYYRTAGEAELNKIGKKLGLDTKTWSGREGFEKSYVPEKVLSGTGAGDTSIAAFLVSMLNGYPPEKCLQYAAATGACCVAAYDALSGLRPLEELEEKINSGWKKNSQGERYAGKYE